MRKINTTKMLCAVAGLAFCSQTMAQTDLHDSIDLHEVQIVGKTKARKMHEQAYAISVVDLATKYQSASALNQVLNTVTSIKIREDGGLGSNYSFAMNGFSGNQVKFFIDGIPMDNFGSSFNLANISANMADRIAVMYLGHIVEMADKDELFANPQHPYTRALLASIPIPDPEVESMSGTLTGDVPSPLNPPSGCCFHTRCPHATDACRQTLPQLVEVAPNHFAACPVCGGK